MKNWLDLFVPISSFNSFYWRLSCRKSRWFIIYVEISLLSIDKIFFTGKNGCQYQISQQKKYELFQMYTNLYLQTMFNQTKFDCIVFSLLGVKITNYILVYIVKLNYNYLQIISHAKLSIWVECNSISNTSKLYTVVASFMTFWKCR